MSANNVPSKLPQICTEATVVAHQCILCREKYVNTFVINLIAFADVCRSYSCRIPVHPPGKNVHNFVINLMLQLRVANRGREKKSQTMIIIDAF
eukprot:scaffold197_cov268-Chaetoceros_neogracile.AAC.42